MVNIVVSNGLYPPGFAIDAFVIEQDRDLLLENDGQTKEPRESLPQLIRAVEERDPPPPGSVLLRGDKRPYELLAMVHDFSREPSLQEDWVAEALAAVMGMAASRRFTALGLPLLGTVHGRLPPERALNLLARVLPAAEAGGLENLWLLCGDTLDPALFTPLRAAGHQVRLAKR